VPLGFVLFSGAVSSLSLPAHFSLSFRHPRLLARCSCIWPRTCRRYLLRRSVACPRWARTQAVVLRQRHARRPPPRPVASAYRCARPAHRRQWLRKRPYNRPLCPHRRRRRPHNKPLRRHRRSPRMHKRRIQHSNSTTVRPTACSGGYWVSWWWSACLRWPGGGYICAIVATCRAPLPDSRKTNGKKKRNAASSGADAPSSAHARLIFFFFLLSSHTLACMNKKK